MGFSLNSFCSLLLGKEPLVPEVRESSDQGAPIVVSNPEFEVTQEFNKIADKISE
ncbi:hypothetical protein [Halobacteroides halobius]|uniref:hypothetical protein n=1 Tax=Halobacteroides halobius TaxID=42422 RepID=UPI0003134226|nr:hypothetical protein [Halobacteroides halobius]